MQSSESVLPSCLPFSSEIPADLLPVVKVWPDLPEHLKAAILTLVNASQPRE